MIAHICAIQATMATSDGVRIVVDSLGYATCKDRKQKCKMIEINGAMFDVTWSINFENVHIIKHEVTCCIHTHAWVSALSA